MRLGDILLAAGRVQVPDVERALARQRQTGARIGAALVEAGLVDVDDVARALARQHGVPAALTKHLTARDPALAARVPGELARALWALPVAQSRGAEGLSLVVCFRDPSADHVRRITEVVRGPVIPAVACELALRRELDIAYPPARGHMVEDEDAAVDVSFDEPSQPFGALDELALVELDDQRVSRGDLPIFDPGSTQRLQRLPEPPPPAVAEPVPAAAVRAATPPAGVPAIPPVPPAPRLDETIARIAVAPSRDAIAEAALDHLRGAWKAAAVLIVKEGMALGHKGFGGGITLATVESIVVPLNQPSFLRSAHDSRRPFVGDAPIGSTAQDRFMKLFAGVGARAVVAAPIIVRDRVVCLLFALGPLGELKAQAAAIAALAHAMGEAYLRLIVESKKMG